MRILHVTDAYPPRRGGIELQVRDLAQAQAADGADVQVLTLTREAAAQCDAHGVKVIRPGEQAEIWTKPAFVWRHRTHGADLGFDVIHAHCSTVSPLAFATAAAARIPTLITVHSLWRRYTDLYRLADRAVSWSRWPVVWSAVSHAAADAVQRSTGRPMDVAVLPNGIDLDAWTGIAPKPRADELRLISVMRLAPRKRALPLVAILRRLRDVVPAAIRLSAVVIGDGPQRARMQREIRRNGLSDWVTLTGHLTRPQIAEYMASSDVFVAPAILESFGIAALEAQAAGLMVVGRRGTGMSDFVRVGDALVDSDRDMVRVIAEIASCGPVPKPPDRSKLVTLSWPAVLERTRSLYVHAGAKAATTPSEWPE